MTSHPPLTIAAHWNNLIRDIENNSMKREGSESDTYRKEEDVGRRQEVLFAELER